MTGRITNCTRGQCDKKSETGTDDKTGSEREVLSGCSEECQRPIGSSRMYMRAKITEKGIVKVLAPVPSSFFKKTACFI